MTDYIIQATVSNLLFAGLLAFFAWAIQRNVKSASLANLLWAIVLFKLVTPPIVSFPVLAIPKLAVSSVQTNSAMVSPSFSANPRVQEATAHELNSRTDHYDREAEVTSKNNASNQWLTILGGIWAVGSLVLLLLSVSRILRFHLLLRRSSQEEHHTCGALVKNLTTRLGLRKAPAVWTTHAKVAPFVWWLKGSTSVVIPEQSVRELSEEDLRLVLAHELAHIRRRDHWFRWVEWSALVLFWWNPIVWLARKQLRVSEEMACDELVLKACATQVQRYANSLLNMAEILASPSIQPPIVASALYGGGCLEKRLKMMIGQQNWAISPTLRWGILASAACFFPLGLVYGQDYEALEKRLGGAVEAGELTLSQANIMLEALRKSSKDQKTAKKTVEQKAKLNVFTERELPFDRSVKDHVLHRRLLLRDLKDSSEADRVTTDGDTQTKRLFYLFQADADSDSEKKPSGKPQIREHRIRRYEIEDADTPKAKAKEFRTRYFFDGAGKVEAVLDEDATDQVFEIELTDDASEKSEGKILWVPEDKDEKIFFEVKPDLKVETEEKLLVQPKYRVELKKSDLKKAEGSKIKLDDAKATGELFFLDRVLPKDKPVVETEKKARRTRISFEEEKPHKEKAGAKGDSAKKESKPSGGSDAARTLQKSWLSVISDKPIDQSVLTDDASVLEMVKNKVRDGQFRKQLVEILEQASDEQTEIQRKKAVLQKAAVFRN